MDNIKKLKLNTMLSLLNQAIVLLSGFIIPRYILKYYGSDTNGLLASITQFLSIITFLEMGVGTVVQSALYKPLALGDEIKINKIMSSARLFFHRIVQFLIIYIVLLIVFLPNLINSEMPNISIIILIISVSLGTFAQYYFGITNQLLLNADQKSYISISVQVITTLINIIMSIVLITTGSSIELVRLVSSIVFLIRPIYICLYVKKNYNIKIDKANKNIDIPQKWNGAAQHLAYTIMNSTDIVILTFFSSLANVSIYSVYNIVYSGLKFFFESMSVGLRSFFGNIIAKENINELRQYFLKIEWIFHSVLTLIFAMTIVLIDSFINLYTNGITDIEYSQPIFAILMALATFTFCSRLPYNILVMSAGHFKETQNAAFIEAIVNIIVSVIFVYNFGLIGVAIGTLVATIYRCVYLVWYSSKVILSRNIIVTLKQYLVDLVLFTVIIFIGNKSIVVFKGYVDWIIFAVKLGVISVIISIVTNVIFYFNNSINLFKQIFIGGTR